LLYPAAALKLKIDVQVSAQEISTYSVGTGVPDGPQTWDFAGISVREFSCGFTGVMYVFYCSSDRRGRRSLQRRVYNRSTSLKLKIDARVSAQENSTEGLPKANDFQHDPRFIFAYASIIDSSVDCRNSDGHFLQYIQHDADGVQRREGGNTAVYCDSADHVTVKYSVVR